MCIRDSAGTDPASDPAPDPARDPAPHARCHMKVPCRRATPGVHHSEYIDGAKEGDFINTVTGENYGSSLVVVNAHFKEEYVVWRKRTEGGGLVGNFPSKAEASQYLEDSDADPAMIFEKDNFSENNSSQLYEAINQLDDRSRDILQDRWLADEKLTLHQLAEKYHISAERVRQIEKNAMKKIKQSFSSGE